MNDRPTYIVTGATGGIGREIVRALSDPATWPRGETSRRIVMAVRNTDAAARVAEQLGLEREGIDCEIEIVRLDLCSLDSVRQAAAEILANGWRIAALVNNAGVMPGEVHVTGDGHEMATQVNYIGTRLFTELLMPAITDGAAIVFTTSLTRHIARCRDDWDEHALRYRGIARRFVTYGRSKRMIATFAGELARQLAERGIRVNCADPGIVDTNMVTMGNSIVDYLSARLFRPIISTPAQGAEPALRALTSDLSGYIFTRHHKTKNTTRL